MMRRAMLMMAVPMLLLAGCELKVGKDDKPSEGTEEASVSIAADGNVAISASDGSDGVAVNVPGFEGRVKIPGMKLGGDDMDINGMNPYPGSSFSSINITDPKGPANGRVAMRFTAPAAPDKVASHFAAQARANGFTGVAVASKGGTATLTAQNDDGDPVTITMAPGPGGTAGTILIRDSGK